MKICYQNLNIFFKKKGARGQEPKMVLAVSRSVFNNIIMNFINDFY